LPDDAIDASEKNRESLINAYDNSIVFTDYVLATLIDKLKGTQARTALLYASDHGEDIFDDERGRFLHASPVPTYWQIHQASLVWLSPTLTQENPEMAAALAKNGTRRLSPQKSLFPTAMQLAGINSPLVVDSLSVVSPNYNPAPAVYLNDLNHPLPLTNCGLTPADLRLLQPLLR
jgi:glucan phosphoethanolaminetransferase (alkaline phosphatase superfamily)